MKRKQIASFCSLFSLVLILSVYYVLSPIKGGYQEVSNEVNKELVELSVSDGESAYFSNLDVLKEVNLNKKIEELELIVAGKDYSINEKVEALNLKNKRLKMNEEEKKIQAKIKELGYENVYVEYENNKINILVAKKDATKKDALDVIMSIYDDIGNKYIPLVTFKS